MRLVLQIQFFVKIREMGCSCGNKSAGTGPPAPTELPPASWGPNMWRVLHTFVEMTGRKQNKFQDNDEKQQWAQFISILREIIPCTRCRLNFNVYYEKNNPTAAIYNNFGERRDALRIWFYNLHLETPKIIPDVPTPTLADLETMYSPSIINITEEVKCMLYNLQTAVNLGLIPGMSLFTFKNRLAYLTSYLY